MNEEYLKELKKIKNLESLENSPNYLKNDFNFVLESIEVHETNLKYASEDLKNNRDFGIKAVKKNGNAFI